MCVLMHITRLARPSLYHMVSRHFNHRPSAFSEKDETKTNLIWICVSYLDWTHRSSRDGACRGIVESSRSRGAIELGRERGFGDVGCSGNGMTKGLPSFGSRNGGETLRAAIIHYKAIYADYNERCVRASESMP